MSGPHGAHGVPRGITNIEWNALRNVVRILSDEIIAIQDAVADELNLNPYVLFMQSRFTRRMEEVFGKSFFSKQTDGFISLERWMDDDASESE